MLSIYSAYLFQVSDVSLFANRPVGSDRESWWLYTTSKVHVSSPEVFPVFPAEEAW